MVMILASTAVSNYEEFKARSFNTVSQSDYRNIKLVMFDEAMNAEAPSSFNHRNVTGPAELPDPLSIAKVSEGVRVVRARRRTRRNGRELIRLEVEHENTRLRYRYVSNNGTELEQVIQR